MHHALEIQEIVYNIFGHFHPFFASKQKSNLAALAGTCHAFKDPALDLLWEDLSDLSPLARCLPAASRQASSWPDRHFSFHRSLTLIEWDILRGYTRRVRYIRSNAQLTRKSIEMLLEPPTTDLLFPNLRHLSFRCTHKAFPLSLLPLPSLTTLEISTGNQRLFMRSIRLFSDTCPTLTRLSVRSSDVDNILSIDPRFIYRLRNLRTAQCPELILDFTTLMHLSRMPALTALSFTLSGTLSHQVSHSDSSLVFSHLDHWGLRSKSLDSISCLLSHVRLLAIESLDVSIGRCPSRLDLSSFFACVRTSGISPTIQHFWLSHNAFGSRTEILDTELVLGWSDFKPIMTFNILRSIYIALACKVDLTDNDLLSLASMWPRLEALHINMEFGWNKLGGITPNGLLQLLDVCRSLRLVSLAMDARGYRVADVPLSLASREFVLHQIDVLDSAIEEESVPAIAAFFSGIFHHYHYLGLYAWQCDGIEGLSPREMMYKSRWEDVAEYVITAVRKSPHHSRTVDLP